MSHKDLEKEFSPYSEAYELKKLGFDEPCFGWYDSEYQDIINYDRTTNSCGWLNGSHCSAPTFSQAFRWFMEKYDLKENFGSFPHHTIMRNYVLNGGKVEEAELACLRILILFVNIN